MNLKNKKVLVMGLGLIGGGVDIVKWLNKNGAEIIVTDLKSKEELKSSIKKLEGIPIEFVLGQHRKSDFRNVDLVIKNSSIPDDSFYLKVSRSKNIPIETDISLFFKLWNRKSIIGITGTKGKSTTANLVYRILKLANFNVRLAGNIGKSPLRYLGKITKDAKFVLELSSWQLRSLRKEKISPHISVITNIFPDHLNYYKKLSSYIADKKLIFNFQSENDWLVLNYENKSLRNIVEKVQSQIVFFSKKVFPKSIFNMPLVRGILYIKNDNIIFQTNSKKEKILHLNNIKLKGQHNLENALAAISVSLILGIKTKIIRNALKRIAFIPNRLELVAYKNKVRYYNDTTATIPEATISALKTFRKKKIILIAGGSDKGLCYNKLAKEIKNRCSSLILLPGDATVKLKKYFERTDKIKVYRVNNMEEAIRKVKILVQPGNIVLLSPAAASFNIFKNEFDRGYQFCQMVKKMI